VLIPKQIIHVVVVQRAKKLGAQQPKLLIVVRDLKVSVELSRRLMRLMTDVITVKVRVVGNRLISEQDASMLRKSWIQL
jgi:hypothetical protein